MSRHVTRLFKSIRKLGLVNGCAVYYCYAHHRIFRDQKWASRQVTMSNVSHPIWMRPGVSDWIVMERIFLDREYDPVSDHHDRAMDLLMKSIVASGKKPLIIDCGANIGLSSVWFSERFPGATVVAIEPEPANFQMLSLNAGNFPNIIPINAAISDRLSRVTLSNSSDTPWAWKSEETETGEVAAVTIPHVVSLHQNHVLMAVKLDIEGFEVNLFRDDTGWVDDLPMMVFEMHDWMMPWSGSGHSFFSVLTKRKRDYLVQGENLFSYSHAALAAYHS
jgi:FkbM family methyltransferase